MQNVTQLVLASFLGLVIQSVAPAEDWARFRGPNGKGISEDKTIPLEWSSTKNLKWRAELPGAGASSPIVSGNRVYLTCYTGYGLDRENPGKLEDLTRHLLAFDRETGKEIWRRSIKSTVPEDPYQGFITQHGYASSTPVTDGERIIVLFGKSGLFCFDRDGNQLWQTSLGTKSDPAKWGDGTSPVLYEDRVIVNAGILGNQFVAVDKETGKIIWKLEDDGFTNCWSTPAVVTTETGQQLLFNVPGRVIAVDPGSGKKLWQTASPLNDSTCGCIVTEGNRAYLMGSRAGNGMALECSEKEGGVVWQKSLRSGIDTPLLLGDQLYWHSSGIFNAANVTTGEYVYRERLSMFGKSTSFPNVDYSSPVASGKYIVQFMRNGESFVIEAGKNYQEKHHNPGFEGDDSAFSGTPAISDGELFVRSYKYLYAIAQPE